MKKLLILTLIVLASGALFYTYRSKLVSQDPSVSGDNLGPDPSSATFIFDDTPVTLSGGKNDEEDENGLLSETRLLEERATGDINKDGRADTALLLARSGGASGVFIYIAGYISGPVSYKGTNAIFIGDRVAPRSISIDTGVVTLKYLDRGEDEPFSAEPTIERTMRFVYQNGEFVER